jgi:hypothetical protein
MQYVDITEYKYWLWQDEVIQTSIFPEADILCEGFSLTTDGVLTLKGRMFMWDGPSGPTIDTPDSMLGSGAHDAFYRMFRLGLLDLKWRREADNLLKEICISQGMSEERAEIWFIAVRKFAMQCAEPDGRPEFEIQFA